MSKVWKIRQADKQNSKRESEGNRKGKLILSYRMYQNQRFKNLLWCTKVPYQSCNLKFFLTFQRRNEGNAIGMRYRDTWARSYPGGRVNESEEGGCPFFWIWRVGYYQKELKIGSVNSPYIHFSNTIFRWGCLPFGVRGVSLSSLIDLGKWLLPYSPCQYMYISVIYVVCYLIQQFLHWKNWRRHLFKESTAGKFHWRDY